MAVSTGVEAKKPEQQEATLEMPAPAACEQPTHIRYEANPDQAGKAEAERDELAQRLENIEEELQQSMQDVEDQCQEKYSALEEGHKEKLKLKG